MTEGQTQVLEIIDKIRMKKLEIQYDQLRRELEGGGKKT
jgi:hypothetical protein